MNNLPPFVLYIFIYALQEKALKESEEHSMQYQDVERKLHRLSSNHAKKMAESANEIQSLKVIVSFD